MNNTPDFFSDIDKANALLMEIYKHGEKKNIKENQFPLNKISAYFYSIGYILKKGSPLGKR